MTTGSLNPDCVGRTTIGGTVVVDLEAMEAFAASFDDDNPAYFGPDAVAHPLFPVRLLRGLMPGILGDPDLGCDMTRLVHGEQRYDYLHPVRPEDEVRLEGTILAIEDKHSGQVLRIEQRLRVGDDVAIRGEAVAFIRGAGSRPPRAQAPVTPDPAGTPEVLHCIAAEVASDQAHRYAAASGDHNPIHLDPDAAAEAGLPGVILHGTCTLALAVRGVVDGVLERDPGRLGTLAVRFRRPVGIPDRVTTEIWSDGNGGYHFETVNRAGERVLTNGFVGCL